MYRPCIGFRKVVGRFRWRFWLVMFCGFMLLGYSFYSLSSASASSVASVQEKGLAIIDRVVCLDLTKYTVIVKTAEETLPALYLGMATQENVVYDLASEKGRLRALCTFMNGELQFLHVLEWEEALFMDEKALIDGDVIKKAEAFLENYRLFTGNPLYGKLAEMLQEVPVNRNFTGTSGNAQLEATFADAYTTFKWTYSFNGIVAPSKFVAIGFKNGHLTAFVDNWQVHEVGSMIINLSEKEALEIALDAALKHSWTIPLEAETLRNLKVSWAELIFDHSVGADNPHSENFLQLYPVWRVGISLDKWYGYIYGIEIDIWADNNQLRRVREAWSTLPPPEGVPTANLSTLIAPRTYNLKETPYKMLSSKTIINNSYAKCNTSTTIIVPALCMITIPPLATYRKGKRRYIKIAGTLLCLTILTVTLLQSMPARASQTKAAVIWGSESTGAYDPRIGQSWRKHPTEIQCQRYISNTIANFFSSNGYAEYNHQGYPGSLKSNILSTLSSLQSSFDRVAVIVFDHGVGSDKYSQAPPGEFHFMFEDNVGTVVGPHPGTPQPDNGVYDMDIYPRTISGKIVFAFIGTCLSASLTNPITGEPWQGLVDGRARGLPFAFTKRFVLPRTNPRFDVRYHISADGYSQPDSGPQCYIGFTFGSASLMQRIPYNTGIEYVHWVYYSFYYALSYTMSVNHALDHASWQCWGQYFGTCPLRVGFIAVWWFWSPTSGWYTWSGSGKMAVYGNGNIYLRQ